MNLTIQNINRPGVLSREKGQNNIVSFERRQLKVQEVPKVMWLSFRNPKISGMNVASWLSYPAPLLFGVPLMAGLVARAISDEKLKKHQIPDQTIKSLRDAYPVFYLGMLLCGLVNGVAYASLSRMLSYSLLSAGSLYLWNAESRRNKASESLIQLQNLPNFQGKQEQLQGFQNQLSDSTSGIAAFSRMFYCFAMFFTFLANVTQTTDLKHLKYPGASESMNFKDFIKDFKNNFKEIAHRELNAGLEYSKSLLTFDGFKKFSGALSGRDKPFEEKLDSMGVKKGLLHRLPMRMGHPFANCYFTMANGVLRFTTVLGTFITAQMLGGNDIFNHKTSLEKPETAKLVEEKPFIKKVFDAFLFLNNVGMLLMGLCSFATGFNSSYRQISGKVAALFQILTGALYTAAAAADQMEMFILAVILKVLANIMAQYSNITATGGKSYPRLAQAGLV